MRRFQTDFVLYEMHTILSFLSYISTYCRNLQGEAMKKMGPIFSEDLKELLHRAQESVLSNKLYYYNNDYIQLNTLLVSTNKPFKQHSCFKQFQYFSGRNVS